MHELVSRFLRSIGESAPEVTVENRHKNEIIGYYNPGHSLAEITEKDHPMAPESDLDLPPTDFKNLTRSNSGIGVVVDVLSHGIGASYAEVWMALRSSEAPGWRLARHLNGRSETDYSQNGLFLVRKYGYRLTYEAVTGKYRALKEED